MPNFKILWTASGRKLGSLLRIFALFLIRSYQVVLGPILGGACRFEPSCSKFAEQAVKTLPLANALSAITKRLLRCRPGGGWGWDPVSSTTCGDCNE